MSKVLLVDGENFKKKLRTVVNEEGKKEPEWHTFNFKALLDGVLKGVEPDRALFYFARLKERPETREKSKQLIEEQRLLKTHLEQLGYEVVMSGRVRGQIDDGSSGKKILVFKEKGVDVQIAVDMVSWACDEKFDTFILGSSDSDLQPAVREVKKRGKKCIYLGFESHPNKGLAYTTDRTILIRNSEILDVITSGE